MRLFPLKLFFLPGIILSSTGTEERGGKVELSVRASEINPDASEHPEINYTFAKAKGKFQDMQHAIVDTRVPPRDHLVIWLMSYNAELSEYLAGLGLHLIQPHYANRWFSTVPKETHDTGECLGNIRLEAATGQDHSALVDIPKADGLVARSLTFVKWLAKENLQGKWERFLNPKQTDLLWYKVILAGSSHGSTTSARFAKHQKVARVVAFAGPRDQLESWQSLPSATPANRYFGFTHVLDKGWTAKHYCRSWEMLGLAKFGALANVEQSSPPYGNSRRLITDFEVDGNANKAHGVVVRGDRWKEAWKYLFTHPVDDVGKAVEHDPDCVVERP